MPSRVKLLVSTPAIDAIVGKMSRVDVSALLRPKIKQNYVTKEPLLKFLVIVKT